MKRTKTGKRERGKRKQEKKMMETEGNVRNAAEKRQREQNKPKGQRKGKKETRRRTTEVLSLCHFAPV